MRKMNGEEEKITDRNILEILQSQVRTVYLKSIAFALVPTIILLIFP